jgi:hypothetical protein
MTRVRLLHWNAAEAAPLINSLTRAGFQVEYDEVVDSRLMRTWREDPPAAILVDLSRLPSRGREIAIALRQSKKTRLVPIVFFDGAAEKVRAIRAILPDANYCSAAELVNTAKRAQPLASAIQPADMMNRYGTRTTAQKLGVKAGDRVAVVGAPRDVGRILGELPERVEMVEEDGAVTLCFVHSVDDLRADISRVRALAAKTKLWFVWRKKGAAGHCGVTETLVRETGIDLGLVDYKICSVDHTWTAMLFARRK